jgi:hypothetical protein
MTQTKEQFEVLRVIGENLRTQDNLATDKPLFIVQEKREIYTDNADDEYHWVDSDFDDVDLKTARMLDRYYLKHGTEKEGFSKSHYKTVWEFVTACFTQKGCEDYIAVNGHNLKSPRIYVASAYRNTEWNAVRDYLLTH